MRIMDEKTHIMLAACPHGLNLREAFLVARQAQYCVADIWLDHDGYRADAKSLMAILRLGVLEGGQVAVITEGIGSASALAIMADLFSVPGPAVFERLPAPARAPA